MSLVLLLGHSAEDFVVKKGVDAVSGDSLVFIGVPYVFPFSLFVVLLVYHHLLQRHEVELWA